jgi:hypothetical protein
MFQSLGFNPRFNICFNPGFNLFNLGFNICFNPEFDIYSLLGAGTPSGRVWDPTGDHLMPGLEAGAGRLGLV